MRGGRLQGSAASLERLYFASLSVAPQASLSYTMPSVSVALIHLTPVVALHRVLRVGIQEQVVVLDSNSVSHHSSLTAQSLVLSFRSFPLESLLDMHMWDIADDLEYCICGKVVDVKVPEECNSIMPSLLKDLIEKHDDKGVVLDPDHAQAEKRVQAIKALVTSGVLQRAEGGILQMTDLGKKAIRPGLCLSQPRRALKPRAGIELDSLIV